MISGKTIFSQRNLNLVNFIFWFVLLSISLLELASYQVIGGEEIMWENRLTYLIPNYFTFWLLTYAVYYLYFRTNRGRIRKIALMHFVGAIVFAGVHVLSSFALLVLSRQMIGYQDYAEKPFWEVYSGFFKWLIPDMIGGFAFYCLLLIILIGWDFYNRYKNQYIQNLELESKLTQSQLQTLKMQLQPHFLFNALNTISMMIRRKKDDQAVEMLSGLSEILRETLTREKDQFVKLSDEIDLAKKYLEIEQGRFKEKVKVDYDIQKGCEKLPVPNLLLQPIVENAIKHGISHSLKNNEIRISAHRENGTLLLEVFNTGKLLDEDFDARTQKGIGLSNTISRIDRLYREEGSLKIANESNEGVKVTVKIPLRTETNGKNSNNHR